LLPLFPTAQLPRPPYFKSSFCGSQLLGCRALHSSCISIFKELPALALFSPSLLHPISGDEKAALSGDEKISRSDFSAPTCSAEPLFRTVEALFWAAPFVRTRTSKPMPSTLTTSFWGIFSRKRSSALQPTRQLRRSASGNRTHVPEGDPGGHDRGVCLDLRPATPHGARDRGGQDPWFQSDRRHREGSRVARAQGSGLGGIGSSTVRGPGFTATKTTPDHNEIQYRAHHQPHRGRERRQMPGGDPR